MISNKRGVSIIEVLVALAIVSVISMALAQMMKDSINATSYSESKFEEMELARQLQMQLSLKAGCDLNFKNKQIQSLDPNKYDFLLDPIVGGLGGAVSAATGPVKKIMGINGLNALVDSNGRKMVAAGDFVGNRSLKINAIGFGFDPVDWAAYQSAAGSLPVGSKGAITMGSLVIAGERVKTSYGGKTFSRSFPVRLLLDASGKVNSCYTDIDAAADAALTIINNQITQVVNNTIVNNNTNVTNNPKQGCDGGSNPMGWFGCMIIAFFSGQKF